MVTVRRGPNADRGEPQWANDGVVAGAERPAGLAPAGLPTLHFFRTALRRGAWQWGLIAMAGFLIGLTLSVLLPSADQAATSVLLTHNPSEGAADAIQTDMAMARSRPVAERAMNQLGLRQSVGSFMAAYSVTPITDRMILITVGAPTMSEAMTRADAVARSFLQFRAQQLRAQVPSVLNVLDQRINVAWRQADALAVQIARQSGHAKSRAQKAELKRLKARGRHAGNVLNGWQLAASAYQSGTAAEIADSRILDSAAAVTHTQGSMSPGIRDAALYAVTGLIPGLALGMGFVIVRALVSRRLSRRDDVAAALGVSIGLSVGAVRRGGPLRGGAAAGGRDPQRIVVHLRKSVPRSSAKPAALAVVAVDDLRVPALSLTSLAVSYAEQGSRVVLADLCRGAPAARRLGASDPGVHQVDGAGGHLMVAIPGPGSVAPVGPLRRGSALAWAQPSPELAMACRSADLLLTLVQLDPALGADHLATWAGDAVVMVTAGRSSAVKIHAVGEMVRLADVRFSPAVLVAADKADESLGVARETALSPPVAYGVAPG